MTGTHDLLGVGIGPFNLSLAALLDPVDGVDAVFFDQADGFAWHPGLLVEGTTTQVPFLADLVTLADPTSRHSFLEYLRAHDRLYRFYLRERFHLPRREYDHYCRWVAGRLAACRFGTRVEGLRWLPGPGLFEAELTEVGSGRTSRRRARNLVLGVGWAPAVPAALAGALGKDVFHAAEFLSYQAVPGLPHDRLLAGELDPATAGGFTATLAATGADPGDYLWFPVHDWQWEHVVVPLFAPSLAAGDLVPLGQGPDEYLPQQSIRTLTNRTTPRRHHLKLPMSILNTLVWRGLPTDRTLAAPWVTEFLTGIVAADPFLGANRRLVLLGEVPAWPCPTPTTRPCPAPPTSTRSCSAASGARASTASSRRVSGP
jgi:hypothetical protein